MKQLKKTILTLVALLAVTTGAWADETPLVTIENKDYPSFTSGNMTFDDKVTVTFSNTVQNDGDDDGWYIEGESLLTVTGINGYTITSCKFYTANGIASTGYTIEGESQRDTGARVLPPGYSGIPRADRSRGCRCQDRGSARSRG